MNELDEVWEQLIAEAAKNPQNIEREGLKEFINVKTANDEIRQNAVRQLFDSMRSAAEHANLKNAAIIIESEDTHRFSIGEMRLTGAILRFRQGIRAMSVEAGWTRSPSDSFMRGGALAIARIAHFGNAGAGVELHLLKHEDRPQWFTVTKLGLRVSFEVTDLICHFQIFLGIK